MDFSIGFIVAFVLIIFPGLIFRRAYFYGPFSKEFGTGRSVLTIIAVSSIPGFILLCLTFAGYNWIQSGLLLENVVDEFKRVTNPDFSYEALLSTGHNDLLSEKLQNGLGPFLLLLYTTSLVTGWISSRIIHYTNLDSKVKLLRFKNSWFYLFNGDFVGNPGLKSAKQKDKKFLFANADILIGTDDGNLLYSGVLMDYELREGSSTELGKVVLRNAKRYKKEKLEDGRLERIEKRIPGSLLTVNCDRLINLNITYVYSESEGWLKSKWPFIINTTFQILVLLLIPCAIMAEYLLSNFVFFKSLNFNIGLNILIYFTSAQILFLLNPLVSKQGKFQFVSAKGYVYRIIVLLILLSVNYLVIVD